MEYALETISIVKIGTKIWVSELYLSKHPTEIEKIARRTGATDSHNEADKISTSDRVFRIYAILRFQSLSLFVQAVLKR